LPPQLRGCGSARAKVLAEPKGNAGRVNDRSVDVERDYPTTIDLPAASRNWAD
jgi:hypothetical protein